MAANGRSWSAMDLCSNAIINLARQHHHRLAINYDACQPKTRERETQSTQIEYTISVSDFDRPTDRQRRMQYVRTDQTKRNQFVLHRGEQNMAKEEAIQIGTNRASKHAAWTSARWLLCCVVCLLCPCPNMNPLNMLGWAPCRASSSAANQSMGKPCGSFEWRDTQPSVRHVPVHVQIHQTLAH